MEVLYGGREGSYNKVSGHGITKSYHVWLLSTTDRGIKMSYLAQLIVNSALL